MIQVIDSIPWVRCASGNVSLIVWVNHPKGGLIWIKRIWLDVDFLFPFYMLWGGKRFESLANYLLFAVLVSSFPKTAITASSNGLPRLYLADWASNKLSNSFEDKYSRNKSRNSKEKTSAYRLDPTACTLNQLNCPINLITNPNSRKPAQE